LHQCSIERTLLWGRANFIPSVAQVPITGTILDANVELNMARIVNVAGVDTLRRFDSFQHQCPYLTHGVGLPV